MFDLLKNGLKQSEDRELCQDSQVCGYWDGAVDRQRTRMLSPPVTKFKLNPNQAKANKILHACVSYETLKGEAYLAM